MKYDKLPARVAGEIPRNKIFLDLIDPICLKTPTFVQKGKEGKFNPLNPLN